jgi:hypothetical protein
MADERLVRTCDACGQEDDHPHHTIYGVVSFEDPVSSELVQLDRSMSRHLDCCNCDHCTIVLGVAGDARGPALISFLNGGSDVLRTNLTSAGYAVGEVTNG